MAGVYKLEDEETREVYYIGSSVNLPRREGEHRDPQFPFHGPFGRWAHQNNVFPRIRLVVLEPLQHEDREQLKKLCRRREFIWKQQVSSKFGQNDGLCEQPEVVQIAHRKKRIKEWRQKPEVAARQKRLNKLWREKNIDRLENNRDHRNELNRERHRLKRLVEGVTIVPKPRGISKDERLRKRRLKYAEKQKAAGRVFKPSGRQIDRPNNTNKNHREKYRLKRLAEGHVVQNYRIQ
jgi:hypothetical protein